MPRKQMSLKGVHCCDHVLMGNVGGVYCDLG